MYKKYFYYPTVIALSALLLLFIFWYYEMESKFEVFFYALTYSTLIWVIAVVVNWILRWVKFQTKQMDKR